MRKEFLQLDFQHQDFYAEAAAVREESPWAAAVVEADGGFWAFESSEEAITWIEDSDDPSSVNVRYFND